MKTYINPERTTWAEILQRPVFDTSDLDATVREILQDVRTNGDAAVKKYTTKFDGIDLASLEVSSNEISRASEMLSEELKSAIMEAESNITRFHSRQLAPNVFEETAPGVRCWQKTVPIRKVGLYIPGGSAPLLSTALMLGVPAKLAGCEEIVLCSPPDQNGQIHPAILYIAGLLGISQVFRIGGVQAIGAMAYGTETVPKVFKIFGPGNQYVTAAKQLVSRDSVAIDMPAGPSELMVMADGSSVPAYVASDLLSQAEHGPDSQVLLVANSEKLITSVQEEIDRQLETLPRRNIAAKSLENSKMILLDDADQRIEMINEYAPEHLIIACRNYSEIAAQVVNAGSIFLGNYTPESAGDYASGTNHTLPTNGWAHAYGGLNMDAFVKKITLQEISKYGLFNIGSAVMEMAAAEELEAHKNAVKIRLIQDPDEDE